MSAPDDRDRDERAGQRDWRALDRKKDRSAHRKDEKPAGGGKKSQAMKQSAQKEYLAGLHKLFETGDAGGRVAKILPPMPKAGDEGEGSARQAALKQLRAAETSAEVKAAVAVLREKWELPEDPDALLAVLLHPDETIVVDALGVLDRIMPLKRATRRETLRARLRRVEEDEDFTAETRALAAQVKTKA